MACFRFFADRAALLLELERHRSHSDVVNVVILVVPASIIRRVAVSSSPPRIARHRRILCLRCCFGKSAWYHQQQRRSREGPLGSATQLSIFPSLRSGAGCLLIAFGRWGVDGDRLGVATAGVGCSGCATPATPQRRIKKCWVSPLGQLGNGTTTTARIAVTGWDHAARSRPVVHCVPAE